MATGPIESWSGNLAELGPIYPMVGSEVALWVLGMAFWIGWHLWQTRFESKTYAEEMRSYAGDPDKLEKAMRGESR
ncbi:MAG: hypothetical protein QF926_03280 [Alphaproteobacteria bacterium]|jgi:hypothetical protein|nr:hypothetical protein [Alphaproteobacteria bacterium]MDP6515635.1 hypothetical protein [Alphaproteobacteria bacterium]